MIVSLRARVASLRTGPQIQNNHFNAHFIKTDFQARIQHLFEFGKNPKSAKLNCLSARHYCERAGRSSEQTLSRLTRSRRPSYPPEPAASFTRCGRFFRARSIAFWRMLQRLAPRMDSKSKSGRLPAKKLSKTSAIRVDKTELRWMSNDSIY